MISIIIPCYNEHVSIEELVRKVASASLGELNEREIIVVDDGSSDGSTEILRRLSKELPSVRVYLNPLNLGKGAAVRYGLHFAQGDIILIQDADLELDPFQYPDLLGPILSGASVVVYGSRFLARGRVPGQPLASYLANVSFCILTNILFGSRLTDIATAYKAFRRDALRDVELSSTGFEIEPEFTCKFLLLGHKITEIPITYRPRSRLAGKKIRWFDGVKYLCCIIKYRFQKKTTWCFPGNPRAALKNVGPAFQSLQNEVVGVQGDHRVVHSR